jgi:hypothetical protein
MTVALVPYGARMTMTENRPTSTHNGHVERADGAPTLSDQVVLSTAGLATMGFATGRQIVEGLLDAFDAIVTGVLDSTEQLVQANVASDLATKNIGVARQAWGTTFQTIKAAIAEA